MAGPSSKPHVPPHRVDAAPNVVLDRTRHRLLPLASVWFPTPRELRAWQQSGVPLYVRHLDANRIEVGPRLASMWAACFAPVLEGRLEPVDQDTRIHWRRRPIWFTLALLIGWWLVIAAWPLAFAQDPEEAGRWGVFWAFLLVTSTIGPALGWIFGGRSLDEGVPALHDALTLPDVDEDW